MNVLISGFAPFGGREVNNSWEIAKHFREYDEIDVKSVPVSFKKAHIVIIDALRYKKYDLILMLGETSLTNDYVRLERLAINYMDSTTPDNEGYIANDEELVRNAPKAYFSTIPIKKITSFLKELGYKVKISNSTGTFVCNSLYYNVLRYLGENRDSTPALFLHLPVRTNIVSKEEMERIITSILSYFNKSGD